MRSVRRSLWVATIGGASFMGLALADRGQPVAAHAVAPPATVPAEVRAPYGLSDLRVGHDGGLRLSTSYDNGEDRHRRPVVQRITPAGVRLSPLRLFPRSSKAIAYSSPRSALIPDGAVVAVGRLGPGDDVKPDDPTREDVLPPPIRVRTLAADGSLRANDPLVIAGGEEAFPESMVGGPNGAAALTVLGVRASTDDSQVQFMAFKPAGSDHFGPAVRVSDFAPGDEGQVKVVLGPDGGGAVVVSPSGYTSDSLQPIVRRISPGGELGPALALRIPDGRLIGVDSTFGPDGTLLVAVSTSVASRKASDEGSAPDGVYAATLAPDAPTPSNPRMVAGSRSVGGGSWLALAVGPDNRTVVVAPRRRGGSLVFAGTGAQLQQVASLGSSGWADVRTAYLSDGRLVVLWSYQDGGDRTDRIWGAVARPGAKFGVPQPLTRPHRDGVRIEEIAPTANGRVAVAYTDGRHPRAYVSIVRPSSGG